MDLPKKQLLVVGDRVLISPEDGDDRTRVGLYLPATAIDAQQVQTGLIVATGPGDPVADLTSLDDEPWKTDLREGKSRTMQARVGDLGAARQQVELSGVERLIVIASDGNVGGRLHRPAPGHQRQTGNDDRPAGPSPLPHPRLPPFAQALHPIHPIMRGRTGLFKQQTVNKVKSHSTFLTPPRRRGGGPCPPPSVAPAP